MRIKWLLRYWLAVAATGAIALFIPHVGWALGVLACGAGRASSLHWLAWGGACLLYLGGEWLIVERMFRERAGRTAA